MEYKKIIHGMLVVVFLAQIQPASVPAYRNSSCLAAPSIFIEARVVMRTNDYQLLKINEVYYIYIDTSDNLIHIHKTREGWQGEHNGRQCTLALDGEGHVQGDIVVYLLKQEYHIEGVTDHVIYLRKRERPPIAMDEAFPPEEIILGEFQKVLNEFREGGASGIAECRKSINKASTQCSLLRKDNPTSQSEKKVMMGKIKAEMSRFPVLAAEFLCSSPLEVQLLGERLKDTVDMLSEEKEKGNLRTMASSMQTGLDSSELLLQKCLMEQIIMPMFHSELKNVEDFFSTTFVEEGGIPVWTLTLKGRVVAECEFQKKKKGVGFGTTMILRSIKGEEQYCKQYFVKGHQLYHIPKTERSQTGITSGQIFKPNLKELVVYSMLDKLGLGARIDFVTNPYARSGLFIVSEDVSTSDRFRFREATALEEDRSLKETLQREGAMKHSTPLKIALNQFDLLGRIFNLTDFHSGNFGSIGMPTGGLKWKMIDFRVGEERRQTSLAEFLSANSRFNYVEGGILASVLKGRERREKIQTGMDAIEDLRKARRFETQLETTCNEIVQYLESIIPERGMTVAEVLKINVATAHAELDGYKRYVMGNFKGLYDELEAEYVISMQALLVTGELRLSIDTKQAESASSTHIVFDEESKAFTIPRDVVVSAGMIVTLLGGAYLKEIVAMRSSTRVLSQWMEKLDTLEGVDDVEKIMGLFGIVRVIGRDELIIPDLEIINFKQMRNMVTAA